MDEQWRTTPPQEVLEVQRIIDVACEACRKAENAGLLSRGRLRRAAARTVAEQSELLRRTAPWLKDAAIPGTYAGAAAYRDEARTDAYRYVRKLPDRTAISSEMLREHVRATCHQLNAELFADPLPAREVEDIARSIHKWITTRRRMFRDARLCHSRH